MLIILEGCDGSGKSTLARNLANVLNAEIIHCSSSTPNDYEFFRDIISSAGTRNIIADRFCYGQFVYQEEKDRPLGRFGRSRMDSFKELNMLETDMLKVDTRIIFVIASERDIEKRLAARSETIINGLNAMVVQDKFLEVFREHSIFSNNIMVWDTSTEEE